MTRHALLVAAGEQFASGGYHGSPLREILGRCGVTKGALYFHFPDKLALADAVIAATTGTWREMGAEIRSFGFDPLYTLVLQTEQVVRLMRTDPIVRGGIRLLNDPGVPTTRASEHYGYLEAATAAQLTAASELLRDEVSIPDLARSLITAVAGHNLICERTGTIDELGPRVHSLWQVLLPLVATPRWLDAHRHDLPWHDHEYATRRGVNRAP
ncbi:TetR/AcrR family transcriptional regulator [Actinomycetospora endophytica]|uniref:TetR/AcrR family transcriptional regulator n=1 Tax=Actinomycetospora endophytica TaxID=2291215 RepID=A0ABS8PAH8_9PSEU|nr:TetR/AcrR family transcriptional regulator [Actinomycetospora endophytica]MCD2195293.1 TetR/AcrR family transcriptional regulator [Actinomycetospora endophytica]